MADYFCDHGAYADILGVIPAWGVPQEGDGTALGAAPSSSIASIAFSAAPTGGGAFSIGGASASLIGVLGAASADAAANVLANNINASTNQVTAAMACGVPQLRNLVYARSPANGAPPGTCQIMARVGSASLNTATNSASAIASTLNNATVTQFAGGQGGCFGRFINPVAQGVGNSIAARSYGVMAQKPMVHPNGGFGPADNVNVRTGRNTTLYMGDVSFGALVGRDAYINFVFDNGTVWVGDSPSAKLKLNWLAGGKSLGWANNAQFATYRCRSPGGLTLEYSHASGYPLVLANGGDSSASLGYSIEGVHFIELPGGNAGVMGFIQNAIYTPRVDVAFVGCLFDASAVPRPNLTQEFLVFSDNVQRPSVLLTGNEFRWALTGSGAAAVSVPFMRSSSSNAVFSFCARGNTFVNGSSFDLQILSLSGQAPGFGTQIVCENNRGAGFPAGPIGIPSSLVMPSSAFMVMDNLAIGGGAKYETRAGYVGFDPGQPTLSSISPDGTLWSWRMYWTTAANAISSGRPFQSPPNRLQSRLPTGIRTWSQELLLDPVALAQIESAAFVEVHYTTPAGMPVCDRTPVVLSSSSAVWAGSTASPFDTWLARRVSGVTSQSVALNSMISFRLSIERPVSGVTTASVLINPEPSIT